MDFKDEFKDKTLVISGGTRGIGRAIVLDFAKNGVNIAFTYNSNAKLAEQQAKRVWHKSKSLRSKYLRT